MVRKRFQAEDIVLKLREVEIQQGKGLVLYRTIKACFDFGKGQNTPGRFSDLPEYSVS